MLTLEEVEHFTRENNHLSGMPSAKEIQENGMKIGEMNNLLLQKIEELTLYIIEQKKVIEIQEKRLNELENKGKLINIDSSIKEHSEKLKMLILF